MYSPDHFKIEDPATLAAFMRKHSFATILTNDDKLPQATHMPVLLDSSKGPRGTLVSHMARANPQWRHFENGGEVLVIFQGPHAYISPAWYVSEPAVPTWNYTAVHAYGIPRIVTDHERFAAMLQDLIEFYEAPREARWPGQLPEEFRDRLMKGIVGVEIEITRLEGKFKLSQNRPQDVPGVVAALAASADQTDREVAAMMLEVSGAALPKSDEAARAMRCEDIPAAVNLWQDSEGVGLSPEETPQMLEAFLARNPGISSAVADAEGRVIGAVLGGSDGRRGYLYHLAVRRDQRGKGLARALLKRTLAALSAAGVAKASIMVYATNETGRAFWQHLGWRDRLDLQIRQMALGAPAQPG